MDHARDYVETDLPTPECHISGCTETAAYEGWARKVDPFGNPAIGNIFIPVCEEHKMSLIGFQNKEKENANE